MNITLALVFACFLIIDVVVIGIMWLIFGPPAAAIIGAACVGTTAICFALALQENN